MLDMAGVPPAGRRLARAIGETGRVARGILAGELVSWLLQVAQVGKVILVARGILATLMVKQSGGLSLPGQYHPGLLKSHPWSRDRPKSMCDSSPSLQDTWKSFD